MKIKSLKLNASTLRIILSVSLFIIIAGAVAGFVFAHQRLTDYAIEISKKKVDAKASETTIQSLETITKQLEDNSRVREIADSLRLNDNHPEFIVSKDLKGIAADNNIDITLTTTTAATDGSAATGTTTTPATPPQTTPAVSPGTFSITMEVRPRGRDAFDESSYKNFLQFLRDLEQNLPKIKVNGVKVSAGSSGDSESSGSETQSTDDGISVEPISLEIYIKK